MSHQGFRTRAIHAGTRPSRHGGATSVPLYNSASFAFDSAEDLAMAFEGRHPGYIYSRISNPTVRAFEARIASLENGLASFAAASGMAAINTLFATLTEAGSRVVFARSLFGGTLLYLRDIAARVGVAVDLVDLEDAEAVEAALADSGRGRPRFLFTETLGNPRLDVADIPRIAEQARRAGVPLIVDATLSSPALFDGKSGGASVVMHSTTKYISGNGTVVGGVITDLATFDWSTHQSSAIARGLKEGGTRLAFALALRRQGGLNTGVVMSPFNAYLGLLGLETLDLRMRAHVRNAHALAGFLREHPGVDRVRYPGLQDDPYYDVALASYPGLQAHGAPAARIPAVGALLTFDVGSRERAFAVANALKLATTATNLGDAKTLIIHAASTIFHDCSDEEKQFSGVTEGLLRVSVGIEDIDDLIADFDQALK